MVKYNTSKMNKTREKLLKDHKSKREMNFMLMMVVTTTRLMGVMVLIVDSDNIGADVYGEVVSGV